ncbi:B3 domain-containing protein At3g25182-like [Gastrolobium bilobum]|uniref:B3 domain-containing protein At3g25182-like n=1 Tax=Gastrolobium bilobum TaxID=150636 RepID=UPI002AB2CEE1|nr:B3 domain-containing protein At3g25182-like [Gastrolobium bilobum]
MSQRDKKTLWDLMANISDSETRQKMSCKPFRPHSLDLTLSSLAPQFYNEEELAQIKSLHEQLDLPPVRTTKTEKEKVTPNQMHEDENATSVNNKKPRKMRMPKNATPSSSSPPSLLLPLPLLLQAPPIPPPPPPPRGLPIEFMNRIRELNGTNIKFLMTKTLFHTDVSPSHNRLSMPINEIRCDFLTEAENGMLEEREGANGGLVGVEVTVLDPCLREYPLILKKWKMTSSSIYTLIKNWNIIVPENNLEKGHQLHIWSFRVDAKLYFALNKV